MNDRSPVPTAEGLLPRPGWQALGRRAERVLLLCAYAPDAPDAVAAAAAAWQARSDFAITVCNVHAAGPDAAAAPPSRVLLDRFDALAVFDAGAAVSAFERVRAAFDGGVVVVGLAQAAAPEALDAQVDASLRERGRVQSPAWTADVNGRNVLVLVPHQPRLDPRIGWMAAAAPAPLVFHQLGMHAAGEGRALMQREPRGGLVQSVPVSLYQPGEALTWKACTGDHPGAQAAADCLLWIERLLALQPAEFEQALGAWNAQGRAPTLHWVLQNLLDTSATLLRQASTLRNVHVLVAADLPALPAALILGALFRAPVVYDAHEYWPEADLGAAEFEIRFWEGIERRLVQNTDLRATVSPGLARFMQERYGVPFLVLPNAEPRVAALSAAAGAQSPPPCVFLFQGGFVRGRGLDLLIQAWPRVEQQAHLVLRGPLGEYRDRMMRLARATGLLDKRIFFPPPVSETELVAAASAAHVGLVPYEPQGANHRHCCPNKLSQYMAAGLPILANGTSFVREVVETAGAGIVVDFRDEDALVAAVDRLAGDPSLRARHAHAARDYFGATFHWEALSEDFYGSLLRLTPLAGSAALQVFGPAAGLGDNSGRPRALYVHAVRRPLAHRLWNHAPEPLRRALRPLLRPVLRALWRLR